MSEMTFPFFGIWESIKLSDMHKGKLSFHRRLKTWRKPSFSNESPLAAPYNQYLTTIVQQRREKVP